MSKIAWCHKTLDSTNDVSHFLIYIESFQGIICFCSKQRNCIVLEHYRAKFKKIKVTTLFLNIKLYMKSYNKYFTKMSIHSEKIND